MRRARTAAVLSVIMFLSGSLAAGQTPRWIHRYDGPGNNADEGTSLVMNPDRELYVAGFGFNITGENDLLVLKLSTDGGEEWQYLYNGPGNSTDGANAVALGLDSTVFAAGWSNGGTSADIDFTVAGVSHEGVEQWVYRYNGTGSYIDNALSVACGPDGNVYAAGFTWSAGTWMDCIAVSLYPTGGQRWLYRYNGSGNSMDCANAVVCGQDSNVYVAGYSRNTGSGYDFTVFSLTPDGDERWVYTYSGAGSNDDEGTDICWGTDGNIYAVGYTTNASLDRDIMAVSLTPGGGERWVHTVDGSAHGDDKGNAIAYGYDGNVYMTGSLYSTGTEDDIVVVSLTPGGSQRWLYVRDGPGGYVDEANDLIYGLDDHLYLAGYTYGLDSWEDYAVIRLDTAGTECWLYEYNGTQDRRDQANSVIQGVDGYVYSTGWTFDTSGVVDLLVVCIDPETGTAEYPAMGFPGDARVAVPTIFQERLSIHFGSELVHPGDISLYDISGRLRYRTSIPAGVACCDLHDEGILRLPHGVYFMMIRQNSTLMHAGKITKL